MSNGREDRIRAAIGVHNRKNDPVEIERRARARAKKPPKPRSCPLESWEHLQFAKVLRKLGLFFIHVPNEGKRSLREGRRLKHMGLRRGCPDFLVFNRPPVASEMKRVKGSRVAPEQVEFLEELHRHGWRAFIAYGHEAAVEARRASGHMKENNYGKKRSNRRAWKLRQKPNPGEKSQSLPSPQRNWRDG